MRISTHQFFQRGVSDITDLTGQTQRVQQQISSGKRLQSAADDPASATRILKLESELDISEQYLRNINLASNRLELIEGSIAAMETSILRVRELVIQSGSGALSNAERALISVEINERTKELADLVNTRDRDGSYIFGGFAVSSPPFVATADGYEYQGDDGVQRLQIAGSSYVSISEPGNGLFDGIPVVNNHIEVEAASSNNGGVEVARAAVTNQAVYDASYPEDYVISFGSLASVVPAGPNYSILRKSDGAVLQADTAYDPLVGVVFSGFSVGLSGVPAPGDQFVVQSTDRDDILSIVDGIARDMSSFSNSTDRDAFIADSLNDLDNIQTSLSQGRSRVGGRLSTIDAINNTLESSRLSNNKVLSDIRDLDYAEAVSDLSFLSFVLEASQQSLVRITGLSLFNFLR